MAAGFGMSIRAYDPFLERAGLAGEGVEPCRDLIEGLAWADAVSVHVPKADSPVDRRGGTRGNEADRHPRQHRPRRRGRRSRALIDALRAGRLGAAGLDVFEDEPPRRGQSPLCAGQVVLSPAHRRADGRAREAHGDLVGPERARFLRGSRRPNSCRERRLARGAVSPAVASASGIARAIVDCPHPRGADGKIRSAR